MPPKDARSLSTEQQQLLRIKAVDMVFENGKTQREAANLLGVSRVHVGKWCRAFEQGGYPALELGRRGRKPGVQQALAPWQCAVIVNTITDKMPDQLKMPFVLWERAGVRDLIHSKFSIMLALRTVGDYLKRWNFTPQRPIERAYQQNPHAVQSWLKKEYPGIKEKAAVEGGIILWGDETGVQNHSNQARSYAPPRNTPVVRKDGKRLRANMISAVSNKGHVRFMIYTEKMTQQMFIKFLSQLRKLKHKVFLIVDNLKVHHGKKVKAWLAGKESEIELFYLPSYSPKLNPDEYLNRDLKKNVHSKSTPRTIEALKANILSFMRKIQKLPDWVKKYFNSRSIKYATA